MPLLIRAAALPEEEYHPPEQPQQAEEEEETPVDSVEKDEADGGREAVDENEQKESFEILDTYIIPYESKPRSSTPPPSLTTRPEVAKRVKKSASMKLKKSWFTGFLTRGANSGDHANNNKEKAVLTPPPVNHDPASFAHNYQQKRLTSASATSLIRRSSSRLNVASDVALSPTAEDNYGKSEGTPILLAVRKRSTSDSGYSGEDYTSSSHCESPINVKRGQQKAEPQVPTKHQQQHHGLSFLRLFHKSSATLRLQHPDTELNPNKPYKGHVITSMAHHHQDQHLRQQQQYHQNNSQQQQSGKTKKKHKHHHDFFRKKKPLVAMTSSSMSSLNTVNSGTNVVLHRKGSKGKNGAKNGGSVAVPVLMAKPAHSSSNSVISTGDESSGGCSAGRGSSSNYDSGAFSRTSSPSDERPYNRGHHHNQLPSMGASGLSMSMSRLAMTEPLRAPRLVLAASRGQWPLIEDDEEDDEIDAVEVSRIYSRHNISAERMLSATAASRPLKVRQMHKRQMRARSMSSRPSKTKNSLDVSVTVGVNNNTMVTIGDPNSNILTSRSSNLRRSRSGLPALGTSAVVLQQQTTTTTSPAKPSRSPAKGLRTRNKISTVYLEPTTSKASRESSSSSPGKKVSRSASIVTVMGSQPSGSSKGGVKCDCKERVTVNGQHHCATKINTMMHRRTSADLRGQVQQPRRPRAVDRATNTMLPSNGEMSQPSSLIHI